MKKECKINYKFIIFIISLIFFINFISAVDIQISDCQQLQDIKNNVDGSFITGDYILTKNIDCSATTTWNAGAGFIPIGNVSFGRAFNGTFDGNNHTISNLYINRNEDGSALFGYINRASIKNVGLINVNVNGSRRVSSLSGYSYDSSISNSYSTGSVKGTDFYVGGLIAHIDFGSINNSYSNVNVNGGTDVGGLVVISTNNNISNSYATGNVNGNNNVGGLIGYKDASNILNSYATGNVNGAGFVGGLIGRNSLFKQSNISNSYATGNVNGTNLIGGLAGYNNGNISDSYATGNVSGTNDAGGLVGQAGVEFALPTFILNSFATGNVSSTNSVFGGLIGEKLVNVIIINSYWDNHPGNPSSCYSGGDIGCTAINNNASYFKDDVYPSRQPFTQWDFVSVWGERTNDYPNLTWQEIIAVNVICVSDSSCGTDGFVGSKFCVNGNVYQNSTDFTCNNPGTPSSSCTNSTVSVLNQTCVAGEICSNGACINNKTNQTGGICSNYTRCEDYLTNQTACEQDTCFNKTSVELGGAIFSCANIEFIPNTVRKEKCIWTDGACKLKINTTITGNASASKSYQHTCNEIQTPVGECVDGRRTVNLDKEIIWDLDFIADIERQNPGVSFEEFINDSDNLGCQNMVESCTPLSALVICNDNLSEARVPFFGFAQFIISIFVIGIIYFIILFRKNSRLINYKKRKKQSEK